MKKIIALALAAVMALSMVACGGSKTDVEAGADAPANDTAIVREVANTETKDLANGGTATTEYDANGVKITEVRKDAEGRPVADFEYDKTGLITKMGVYSNEGKLAEYVTYKYNEDGKKVEAVTYGPDDAVIATSIFEYYAESGKIMKEVTRNADGTPIIETEYYDADFAVKTLRTYGENGELIEETNFTEAGEIVE